MATCMKTLKPIFFRLYLDLCRIFGFPVEYFDKMKICEILVWCDALVADYRFFAQLNVHQNEYMGTMIDGTSTISHCVLK